MDLQKVVDDMLGRQDVRIEIETVMLFNMSTASMTPSSALVFFTRNKSGNWNRKPSARLVSPTDKRGTPDEDVALFESFVSYLRHRFDQVSPVEVAP
jgi:hypothetical protein